MSTAVWVLRQDNNRCIFLGTHPSLHQSLRSPPMSKRLGARRAAPQNGCSQQSHHPSSLHWNLLEVPRNHRFWAKVPTLREGALFPNCDTNARPAAASQEGHSAPRHQSWEGKSTLRLIRLPRTSYEADNLNPTSIERLRRGMKWILLCALATTPPSNPVPRIKFATETDCWNYLRTVDRDRVQCTCRQRDIDEGFIIKPPELTQLPGSVAMTMGTVSEISG
jgi:hypothetical protein